MLAVQESDVFQTYFSIHKLFVGLLEHTWPISQHIPLSTNRNMSWSVRSSSFCSVYLYSYNKCLSSAKSKISVFIYKSIKFLCVTPNPTMLEEGLQSMNMSFESLWCGYNNDSNSNICDWYDIIPLKPNYCRFFC